MEKRKKIKKKSERHMGRAVFSAECKQATKEKQ